MEKKIYIVTSGCYSDYQIDAVFSTEELAKQFIERYEADNGYRSDFDIEEWNVDDFFSQDGRYTYTVRWYSNANIEASLDIKNIDERIDTVRRQNINWITSPHCYRLKIKARDKEHAIKIASERMFFIKANPDLFPYLDDLCVKNRSGCFSYPVYDFNTCAIVLDKTQELIRKSNPLKIN